MPHDFSYFLMLFHSFKARFWEDLTLSEQFYYLIQLQNLLKALEELWYTTVDFWWSFEDVLQRSLGVHEEPEEK